MAPSFDPPNQFSRGMQMSKDDKVISRGRFKGKKITFASTAQIEDFMEVANDFMEKLFDLLPGEFLITDESDLRDFTDMASSDTSEMWKQIKEIYGVEYADVSSERLVSIFAAITQRKGVQ